MDLCKTSYTYAYLCKDGHEIVIQEKKFPDVIDHENHMLIHGRTLDTRPVCCYQ